MKPRPGLTFWILSLVALSGLIAQGVAAHNAFGLLQRGVLYSISAAILIEAAAVGEALVFAQWGDRVSGALLALTVLISGIYNYAQADAAAPEMGPVVKITLAIGPLLALTSVGLLLGGEWVSYREKLQEWQQEQESRRISGEASGRAFEREQERIRLEHDLREDRLATRRRERWERKGVDRTVSRTSDNGRTVVRKWPDKDAFLLDPDRPDDISAKELAAVTGQSERNARRWLEAAKKQNVGVGNGDVRGVSDA